MEWKDGKTRCFWANPKNERYIRYHDEEWGVPVRDDHKLFEMLILESFQAGLSWECILNKRDSFREAFDNFDIEKVCVYGEEKIDSLQHNPDIIRNGRKIRAAINNAQVFRSIQKQWGSFANYLWHWTDNRVICETGRTQSPLSDMISKDLRERGMRFVGTITVYAYLQSVGIIYSHDNECFLANKI
jgi:DNA-3-methyladenine glycosylase I